MNWVVNRSIFTKVFSVTATLILITILVGLIGFSGTWHVNRMVVQVIENDLITIAYLYEIKSDLLDTQSTVRNGLLSQDAAELPYLSSSFMSNKEKMIHYYTTQLMQMTSEQAAGHPEYARRFDLLRDFNKLWPDHLQICRTVLDKAGSGAQTQAIQE